MSSYPVQALPFKLDLTCPLPLPQQPTIASWPFVDDEVDRGSASFARRRYLESLFLTELLAPVDRLIEDLTRLALAEQDQLESTIGPLLCGLSDIEKRHRKVILPVIVASVATSTNPSSEISAKILQEALSDSGLDETEKGVLQAALDLRLGSRAADDGAVLVARRLADELEKRETLLQVALLFFYISSAPVKDAVPAKKRKRDKPKSSARVVMDDPKKALELLVDRLSVWSAVADIGMGPAAVSDEDGIMAILRRFWNQILQPHFLAKQPELCASFHLKVFARPISPTLLPAQTVKKPRKPAITRARPSSDALTQPEPTRSMSAQGSRVPSENGSRRSSSRERTLSRSLSARPDGLEMRRSRSNSIDPKAQPDAFAPPKKGLMRAPSGKDMFKGRQVGLMRRTSSMAPRRGKDKESQSLGVGRTESQGRMGLLGRKTSDPKGRRNSEETQTQTQPGTLIFATPSKPRLADSIFGPRTSKFAAPTPIQEEPSSTDRPTYVTETPHGPGRMSKDVVPSSAGRYVAETPMMPARTFVPGTGTSYASMAINALNSRDRVEDSGDEDEDPLADLMVMTDEEDG